MRGALMGLAGLVLCAGSAQAQQEAGGGKRGLSVTVGGGVEGYTFALAPAIDLGATYGVTLGLMPTRRLGLEFGYSGAVNELDTGRPSGASRGVDLARNGAYAATTVGLTSSAVQPYVMGGVGFSHYNVRGGLRGFNDDIVGNIPVGAGMRTTFGSITADARLQYNILFNQQFASSLRVPTPGESMNFTISPGGRYSGTLNLGVLW